MKKIMAIIMLLLCLGLGGFIYNEWKNMDTEPPIIQYEGERVYQKGASDELLLKTVAALDSQDGNVSDSIVVEQIIEKDNTVEVVYVARDQNNNIAKAHVELNLATPTPAPTATPLPTATPVPKVEKKEEKKEEKAEETMEENESEKTPQQIAREEQERVIQELPEGAPRLYLTEYYTEIDGGEEPDYIAYVETIEDNDEDDINELWQRIIIDGFVDSSRQGTYELQYYVIDSNGNQSNLATLTVVVR